MASKQPFKLFNIAQKLTTWSIRINKFVKHRLLSKRKNLLLITESSSKNNEFFIYNNNQHKLKITKEKEQIQNEPPSKNFMNLLIKNFLKTWQITQLKSSKLAEKQLEKLLNSSKQQKSNENKVIQKKSVQTEEKPSSINNFQTILLPSFNKKSNIQQLEKYFTDKKKYYDAVIIVPQQQQPNVKQYPEIDDQSFAIDFIETYEKKIMKNLVAYRFAHKFLTTSGAFIQSTSEYDFLKNEKEKAEKDKTDNKQQQNIVSYAVIRPPASKQLIDSTICYLGIVIGDRDYTDINSWTLVSLSEEASLKNPEFVSKMYYDWADGQQLPMPGSFTLFKRKINEDKKKQLNFVQYL